MWGSKDSRFERAGRNAEVVDEAAAAGQKGAVFHAFDRAADPQVVRKRIWEFLCSWLHPEDPLTAFFGTRFGSLFGEISESGHTVHSHNLPISLI
jgi:hypothetical protein